LHGAQFLDAAANAVAQAGLIEVARIAAARGRYEHLTGTASADAHRVDRHPVLE